MKKYFQLLMFLSAFVFAACGNSGDESNSIDYNLTGIWEGTYEWDCTGGGAANAGMYGSSRLTLAITQYKDKLSGTASYLNDTTSMSGTISNKATMTITGTNSITINYFKGTYNAGTLAGTTVNGENCSAPQGDSGKFNVIKRSHTYETPHKLFIVGPAHLTTDTCSNAFTIEVQDINGNPVPVSKETIINLSGHGSGNFYKDDQCTKAASQAIIHPEGFSANVYFKNATIENLNLVVSEINGDLVETTVPLSIIGKGGFLAFKLDGVVKDHHNYAYAKYDPIFKLLVGGNDSVGNVLDMYIPIDSTGTVQCTNMYYQDTGGSQWAAGGSLGGSCSVTISNFGVVGELIEGTFSGVLEPEFGGATGNRVISEGSFSIVRTLLY